MFIMFIYQGRDNDGYNKGGGGEGDNKIIKLIPSFH